MAKSRITIRNGVLDAADRAELERRFPAARAKPGKRRGYKITVANGMLDDDDRAAPGTALPAAAQEIGIV